MRIEYISDIITQQEIDKWQPGNRILICSQTGSGKSEFIKSTLYEYCKKTNKKILLMSNRNLLKNQNMFDIHGKEDVIEAHNYQEFESRILRQDFNMMELFSPYDYIVYDEAHYFFSDSQFNKNTDLLISPLKNTPDSKIFLFITATPDALLDFQESYDFRYDLPYDYSYIENIYFYNRPKNSIPIVESIIKTIPADEKILYFGSSAHDNFNLSANIKNASFICSSGNDLHQYSNQHTFEEIVMESKFNARCLFSTKILDNGVNIKDDKLKHIFIDMIDPISFIQCLGRKRILHPEDRINLYVRNYNSGNLYYVKKNFENKVKAVRDFKEGNLEDFDDLSDIIKKTGEMINKYYNVNEAKYQHYKTQYRILNNIYLDRSEGNYKRFICKILNFDYDKTRNANVEYEKSSLLQTLEKYEGIKLFDKDKDEFAHLLLSNIFTTKKTDFRKKGLIAVNQVIEEDELPFTVYSRKETLKENQDKRYWMVEALEERILDE